MNQNYEAHNAIDDVKVLVKLLQKVGRSANDIKKDAFSPRAVHNSIQFATARKTNIDSLIPLQVKGICGRSIIEKIAGSDLTLSHLKLIYARNGDDGIRDAFTCPNRDGNLE